MISKLISKMIAYDLFFAHTFQAYLDWTSKPTPVLSTNCEEVQLENHVSSFFFPKEGATIEMICVTTRFHLKHSWQIILMYLSYRRLRRELNTTSGLIRYAFLLQSPLVCYTFSIWESELASMQFSNTACHVSAARYSIRICRNIWSATWHVETVSKFANQWPGFGSWPAMINHPMYDHRLIPTTATKGSDHAHSH